MNVTYFLLKHKNTSACMYKTSVYDDNAIDADNHHQFWYPNSNPKTNPKNSNNYIPSS